MGKPGQDEAARAHDLMAPAANGVHREGVALRKAQILATLALYEAMCELVAEVSKLPMGLRSDGPPRWGHS